MSLRPRSLAGIIFWLGDKAIGGKMFSMINPDAAGSTGAHAGMPISYPAGPERFAELVEQESLVPAPYMARAFWVAALGWDAMRDREWEAELAAAHRLTYDKLPPKTKAILALPKTEAKRIITERRTIMTAKEAAKKAGKAPAKKSKS